MSIGVHLEEELPNSSSESNSFKSEISSDHLQSMEVVTHMEATVSNESFLINLDFLANFVSVRP